MKAVIKVVVPHGGEGQEEELVGVVPGSLKQATSLAEDYLTEHPAAEVVIRRGAKVLRRLRTESAKASEAA